MGKGENAWIEIKNLGAVKVKIDNWVKLIWLYTNE